MDKKKAIFLDRDGIINEVIIRDGKPCSPNNIDELKINPYAKELIQHLKFKNYLTLVVTNQPDVERKKISKENVIEINNFLQKSLNLDDVFVCFSDDRWGFLIAGAIMFPIAIVHGVGIWFGFW